MLGVTRFAWVVGVMALGVACGKDEALEVGTRADADAGTREPATDDTAPAPKPSDDDAFDLSDSRVVEQLQDEQTARALCGLAGVLMVSQQGATEQECEDAVDACNDGFAALRDAGTATAPGQVPSDLSGALDCPATAALVDACLAELVELATSVGGELTCESTDVDSFDVSQLTGAVNCAVLYITCPDLFSSLLGPGDAGL